MSDKTNRMVALMKDTGLVPLFNNHDAAVAQHMVEASYRGGARLLEFTNRKENALDVFKHLVNNRTHYPDMLLGVGTVMDAATAKKFIDAGADYIISPILKAEMADVCRRSGIPWIPGCATLTEIVNARDLGADVIKVFPGSVLGPGFIASILPVVPNLKLMITGGVEPNEANLRSWFKAGSWCVGLGSQLFTSEIISNNAWNTLEARVSHVLAVIHKIQTELNPS